MSSYVKNFVGFKLDPEQMEDIPYPYSELMSHITFKTIEVGTIIGTLGGGLAAVARSSTRHQAAIERCIRKAGMGGCMLGIVLGPVLTIAFVLKKGVDNDGIYDRCYRLRHNRSQLRIDRACDLGFLTGAGVAIVATKPPVFGGVVGCTCGVLLTTVLNAKFFDK